MIKYLINGEPNSQLNATDRGLHYGDGVFETIAVHHGCIQFLEEHYARLCNACSRLQISPPTLDDIKSDITQLISGDENVVIKIIITRGSGGRGYKLPDQTVSTRLVILYPYPDYPNSHAENGIAVTICNTQVGRNKTTAGIKHLNRLENVLASAEWQNSEFMEGFMLDEQKHLIEGTMSNVFIVEQGALVTPRLSHSGVNGIIRQKVLSVAAGLGWAANEENITLNRLRSADEIFITNSVIGLWPVIAVDEQAYLIGKSTLKIATSLKGLMGFH